MFQKIISICILLVLFSSCEPKKIFLPNNEIVTSDLTIKDIAEKYGISFHQYEGFKGKFTDKVLSEFKVDIGYKPYDVIDKDRIDELKNRKIKGVTFEVLSSLIKTDELVLHIQKLYPNSKINKKDSTNYIINDSIGNKICVVKYVEFGIPSSFVYYTFD